MTTNLATDSNNSAWVAAHAGSGKTYILVSRLLSLLIDGALPQKILCLTYTRNAAAEMQARLFDVLAEWACLEDRALIKAVAERTGHTITFAKTHRIRSLFARALETPGGLRIETIHGFCGSLLRRFPLEAGLAPQFATLDPRTAQMLQKQVTADILDAHPKAPQTALTESIQLLMRHLAGDDFFDLIAFILANRSDFLKYPANRITAKIADIIKVSPNIENDALVATAKMRASMDNKSIDNIIKILAASTSTTDKKQAECLHNALTAIRDQKEARAWQELTKFFMTKNNQKRKSLATKPLQSQIGNVLLDAQNRFDNAQLLRRQASVVSLTHAVAVLAQELCMRYEQAKRAQNSLDFDDLIIHTNRLLQSTRVGVQWVLYKIDGGIDHILIDEAQDTSSAQWNIIVALATAFFDDATDTTRTIFAVGDEKQSIFSFQGAAPEKFEEMQQHFKKTITATSSQKFKQIQLDMSRRQAPEILTLVDAVFANDTARSGLSATRDVLHHKVHRKDAKGYVELWPPVKADEKDTSDSPDVLPPPAKHKTSRQNVADCIADKIATLHGTTASGVPLSDVLILVRKRDAFVTDMMRALHNRDLAVNGADRLALLEQIAILDLIRAAEFALLPRDDLALAIFLRSPLGGVSEETLFELAYRRTGNLWDAVRTAIQATPPPPNLITAYRRLDWLLAHADLLTPFDYFARFLSTEGVYRDMTARLGNEIDDPIDEFLRLALDYQQQASTSLQGFLHWLRQENTEIKREMNKETQAVRIMTVHAAKGLEAPIVFLPDTCGRMGGGSRNRDLMIKDPNSQLFVWSPSKSERIDYIDQLRTTKATAVSAEEHRLLYVALTRARDRLYVGGYLARNAQEAAEDSWYTHIEKAIRSCGRHSGSIWHLGSETPLKLSRKSRIPQVSPPSWLTRDAPQAVSAPRLRPPSNLVATSSSYMRTTATPATLAAMARGTHIHRLLEGLAIVSEATRRDHACAYLAPFYPPEISAQMIEQVFAVMSLPELAPLFALENQKTARAEVHIGGRITLPNGQYFDVLGQIDRMIETKDKILVIDFKSGTPAPDKIEYLRQMASYHALVQATTTKPVECGLVWTETASVTWLDSTRLTQVLEEINLEA